MASSAKISQCLSLTFLISPLLPSPPPACLCVRPVLMLTLTPDRKEPSERGYGDPTSVATWRAQFRATPHGRTAGGDGEALHLLRASERGGIWACGARDARTARPTLPTPEPRAPRCAREPERPEAELRTGAGRAPSSGSSSALRARGGRRLRGGNPACVARHVGRPGAPDPRPLRHSRPRLPSEGGLKNPMIWIITG